MNSPRTDAAAHTHARQQLADRARRDLSSQGVVELDAYDTAELAGVVAGVVADAYTVTFERYTNAHGVPVRRVVLYGPEECDPAVPAKP